MARAGWARWFCGAYAHPDPVGSIAKLRVFCEQIVEWIHHDQRLPKPFRASLNDLLHNQPFKDVVPSLLLSKLHALRMEGNSAAHGNKGDTTTALRLVEEAYNIARWLHVSYGGGCVTDFADYQQPPEGGATGTKQRREKRAILERMAGQESQLQKLLGDLEKQRSRADQAEATAEERQAALKAAL